MARSNLISAPSEPALVDPFSKKGALVLFWLLARRILPGKGDGEGFSINRAARELGVRPFTVHRVILTLEYDGIIRAKGMGTKKRFYLADPKAALIKWLRHYHIQRRSKLRRYALSDSKEFAAKRREFLNSFVVPALHTAAQWVFHVGVTNLSTTEGYVVETNKVAQILRKFRLSEQDRGYEVLLIEPYYGEVIKRYAKDRDDTIWKSAFAILIFLDLYHFPIRGREQAEALYRKIPALKSIGSWSALEAIEIA